ncbi:hypothetical protein KI387_016992 [Taxus chinensis]|uniref:Histone acetyltransferase n=1 Tax=Taxus chinensis TaxID=29808 RepID=A0AA38LEX6_TAXCH|nr:hypothetical protein KI387_016992 [Taxus chinensis]
MPRPGPRPYECIRRAWHGVGDSHHTLRGTLIQEIFRVVNEIHCPTTRRKKEWQEKLPMVVLRAEEILYSKANSEAEYMDIKTLCFRLNDAINTMIRRDESTEGGKLLEPCVEAALSLGCLPRKGTRGQRHNLHFSEGRNKRLTILPLVSSLPVIGDSSNYQCLSSVKSQEETRLHGNGVYCTAGIPACHFLDYQQYCLTSTPAKVVSSGSLLCTPSIAHFPSQRESDFSRNRSQETSLNFNGGGISTECSAPFYQQTYPGIIQGGQMKLPQLRTRTETEPVCMPLRCPLLSTSINNVISTTLSIPTSYRSHLFNATSSSSAYGENTRRFATSSVCFVHPDLDLQIQVPSITSQIECLPQTDPAYYAAAVLNLDESKSSMHSCSHVQNEAKSVIEQAPTEESSSESTLNVYDLQLRLAPPGNTCPCIAVNGSTYVDPCSNSSGFRVQIEDYSARTAKASDKLDFHSHMKNQEPLPNSCFGGNVTLL